MLAVGFAWTGWAFIKQPALGGMLGVFFTIWLLVAAAAAYFTQVFLAAKVQGGLGLLLLLATGRLLMFGGYISDSRSCC
jgi:hypothetical protein